MIGEMIAHSSKMQDDDDNDDDDEGNGNVSKSWKLQ